MEETGKKWKKLEKNLSEPSKETFQKAELHNMKTRISFFSQCEFHILLIEGKQQVNESFQTITISVRRPFILELDLIFARKGSKQSTKRRGDNEHPCLVPLVMLNGLERIPLTLTQAEGIDGGKGSK
ncbi:uncharacterized protein LOC122927676 isoform X4 [Bufo gargarizans]|uniref:uncharacterized protein LOC122927676 isoform X4 n=1 Tax=Bufo gargarizans TaxID=30331 RepID=UPI001CF42E33|nr:uncharacterized protein LOC122927676 isoform X4 [Bufo gargarizans]